MTTNTELDPHLLKALEYFRSSSLDSVEKLKAMLDKTIENSKRRQETKEFFAKTAKSSQKFTKGSESNVEYRKKDVSLLQKRHFDKSWQSRDDSQENAKKSHIETLRVDTNPKFFRGESSGCSSPSAHDLLTPTNGSFGQSSPINLAEADDFEREMAGLACAACKEMTVGSGNQLVECQDCHNLYHQDCHQPPISDKEVNDPRCVWYCAKCKQNMKKQEKQNMLHSPHPISAMGNPFDQSHKATEAKNKAPVTPFKRTEMKHPTSSANNGAASLSGWAALGVKSISSTPKEEVAKSSDVKQENSLERTPSGSKKTKSSKNHINNNQPKFLTSDVWAEALGAKSSSSSKAKTSSNKSSGHSSNSKHLSRSSTPWLNNPGSNAPNKHKGSNPYTLLTSKSAPFPKASAATSPIAKSSSTRDAAAKQMHLLKKKAAAKMQQKRARV